MLIYVDIDKTICHPSQTDETNYALAVPNKKRIDQINQLYEHDHTIVYWTARGTVTGLNWYQVTKKQFEDWGVKYHELHMGKPAYDLFIDDKNMNSERFFELLKYTEVQDILP